MPSPVLQFPQIFIYRFGLKLSVVWTSNSGIQVGNIELLLQYFRHHEIS